MISILYLAAMLQSEVPDKGIPESDATVVVAPADSSSDAATLPVVEVRAQRQVIGQSVDSSLSILQASEILIEAPKHPNEIFDRIPGTSREFILNHRVIKCGQFHHDD